MPEPTHDILAGVCTVEIILTEEENGFNLCAESFVNQETRSSVGSVNFTTSPGKGPSTSQSFSPSGLPTPQGLENQLASPINRQGNSLCFHASSLRSLR
jgi:hypothetical protein